MKRWTRDRTKVQYDTAIATNRFPFSGCDRAEKVRSGEFESIRRGGYIYKCEGHSDFRGCAKLMGEPKVSTDVK